MTRYVTGTVSQLVGNVSVNGVVIENPGYFSIIARFFEGRGFRKVGKIKSPTGKGKPTTIWEVDTQATASLSFASLEGLATSPTTSTAEA